MSGPSGGESNPHYEVSLGKTLLDNWVEERKVAHIDCVPNTIKKLHVEGHTGILSQTDGVISNVTTCKDSYKQPEVLQVQKTGTRREQLEQQLYQKISQKIHEEMNPPPPEVDYTSTTKDDFQRDYTAVEVAPTAEHDVNSEQPATFWNQHLTQIDGVTQVKTESTPFKKNAAFSTPIHEYNDSPKPGEQWNY